MKAEPGMVKTHAQTMLPATPQRTALKPRADPTPTIEHDDFTTEPAPAADLAVSRRIARGITRDAILIGIGAGALAAATALVR